MNIAFCTLARAVADSFGLRFGKRSVTRNVFYHYHPAIRFVCLNKFHLVTEGMKMKSKLLTAMLLAVLTISFSAKALPPPDEAQRFAMQRAAAAKAKLRQAEAAVGTEQRTLMAEHMGMMKELMDKVAGMKPKAGMNAQEHQDWMSQHQTLMEQIMDQMMAEHVLMMKSCGSMHR